MTDFPPSPDGVAPLTRQRIERFFDSRGDHYAVDDDGDLFGNWDGHHFYFLMLGSKSEILQVRGRWRSTLPTYRARELALLVNDWNRERLWPKAYYRTIDDQLVVFGETATDLEPGASDAQIGQIITCGIATAIQLFNSLADQFPEAEPEQEQQ